MTQEISCFGTGLAAIDRAYQAGEYENALRITDCFLEEWRDNPALLVLRGRLIQLQENGPSLDEARQVLQRAVEFDPESPAAWLELGHFLNAVDDDEKEAIRCFARAVSLSQSFFEDATKSKSDIEEKQCTF